MKVPETGCIVFYIISKNVPLLPKMNVYGLHPVLQYTGQRLDASSKK